MLAILESDPPRYVLTLNSVWVFFGPSAAYFSDLREWVVANYRLVARYGRHDILARRDLPAAASSVGVDTWQPVGPLEALPDPWLPRRRQAARRWSATLTPERAYAAPVPEDPLTAVLLLRALRDAGDLRASSLAARAADSEHPRVRHEARTALDFLRRLASITPYRWADDVDLATLSPYLAALAKDVERWRDDDDERLRAFAKVAEEIYAAERARRRPDGEAP